MKHPRHWLRWLFFVLLFIVVAEYATLTWVAPRMVIQLMRRMAGGELTVDNAKLSFPLTSLFSGIRSVRNTLEEALSVQSVLVRPRRLSFFPRLLELDTVEIDRPFIRMSRSAMGTVLWPQATTALPHVRHQWKQGRLGQLLSWLREHWAVRVNSVKITEGVFEWIDAHPAMPFHVAVEHATLSIGPLSFPSQEEALSFALRARINGYEGRSAPLYCSGWVGRLRKDLEFSCEMEPLPLAIFDPYFQEFPVIRVYTATVAATSHWLARDNQLEAQMHLELDRLDEGDISFRGRTVVNIKKLAKEGERRLVADIQLAGPLDDPAQWQGTLAPGNEPSHLLVDQLLERTIRMLSVPFLGHSISLALQPVGPEAMQDMKESSKNISEALEMLAIPVEPVVVEAPAAEEPVLPEAGGEGVQPPPAAAEALPQPPTPMPDETQTPSAVAAPETPVEPAAVAAP